APRARLRHPPAHPADLEQRVTDSAGLLVSRALPSGASGSHRLRVGRVRQQAAREVLQLDSSWPSPAQGRSGVLEALVGSDRSGARRGAGGRMTRLPRLRSSLSALLRRRRLEADMEAEWRSHLDAHVDALIAAGMSREEATRRARMDFGDPLRWK